MTERAGYVRLFRKLLQNPLWTQLSPAVLKVAIFFLLRASYRPHQWYDGCKVVDIPAGSLVTSYAKTAEACNLSVQQVRDAFTHLFGTQFATYVRTKRWTLVSISNWSTYQASDDEAEHTEVHKGDPVKNRKGTLYKKERIKNITTSGDEGELFNGNNSAAVTGVLSETLNREQYHPVGLTNANGQPPQIREAIARVAARIHERHPSAFGRRDLSAAGVERKLAAILKQKSIPANEQEDYIEQIDRNHAALCASEGWRKEGGEFAKGLENWLAPSKERYTVAPAVPQHSETTRLMA